MDRIFVGDWQGTLPQVETVCVATDYSAEAKGVLDSGATKTVIGSHLVDSLLQSLSPSVRKKVTRSKCQVTFRFGNLSTLDAQHALVIPIGSLNLRVAIVPGSTPFLISNTLMRALRAVVDTFEQKLHSPFFHQPVSLELTPRGLFLLDINELVIASANPRSKSVKQDTFITEEVPKQCSPDHAPSSIGQPKPTCISDSGVSQDQEVRMSRDGHASSSQQQSAIVDQIIETNRTSSPSQSLLPHVRSSATSDEASCRSSNRGRGPSSVLNGSVSGNEDRFRDGTQRQILSECVAKSPILGEVVSATLRREQKAVTSPSGSLLRDGEIERAELANQTIPLTDVATPVPKTQVKPKAKAKSQPTSTSGEPVDDFHLINEIAEEFEMDPTELMLMQGTSSQEVAQLNQRMTQMESMLSQIVQHLQGASSKTPDQ